MVLIRHTIFSNKIELEIKYSYLENFKTVFHKLVSNGFKYNKLRRTFNKVYIDREYATDRFNSDIEIVKTLFTHYKYECFKLVKEESNV